MYEPFNALAQRLASSKEFNEHNNSEVPSLKLKSFAFLAWIGFNVAVWLIVAFIVLHFVFKYW
jgi:hypothetical protein